MDSSLIYLGDTKEYLADDNIRNLAPKPYGDFAV